MTTLPRSFRTLTFAAALVAGLNASAQAPAADQVKPTNPPTQLTPVPAPVPTPLTPTNLPVETPVKPAAPKAAPKPATKPVEKAAPKKADNSVQFNGRVTEADKVNYTLTLTKARVLQVTPQTRFYKAGKPAIFDDAAVGEEVTGQYRKSASGALEATAIHIGSKPTAPVGDKKKSESKKPADKSPLDVKPEEKKPGTL